VKELSRRQRDHIAHYFREKELRLAQQVEKFRHRAPSGDGRKKESLVRLFADRVDFLIIVSSFVLPAPRPGLIDRFLLMAHHEELEPIIAFNKADLLNDRSSGETIMNLYRSLGYHALLTSTVSGEGLEFLAGSIRGRTSLLAGHSGVGKSSLLQALAPGLEGAPETGEVSVATGKGVHTTTSVKLYRTSDGTAFYDLPGLKYMSFHDVSPRDVAASFPEIARFSRQCRYDDCLHGSEPQCHIKAQVESGMIDRGRYESYRRIVESLS
jgi:ribosome biogenesis GTPase / thiamine phosphate phosphatase